MGMTQGARRKLEQLKRAHDNRELETALEALRKDGIGCLAEVPEPSYKEWYDQAEAEHSRA